MRRIRRDPRNTPRWFRLGRGRGRRTRGQSLVEFALILPVALVLFSAALDLGRLAAARIAVSNASREGAFQAATTPDSYQAGQPCPTPDSSGTTPDTNLVVCRTVLEAGGSIVAIAPADISLACSPSCAQVMGHTVTVTVTGRFTLLTPIMAAIFGGTTLTFSSSSTNQLEALPPALEAPSFVPTAEPTVDPSADPSPSQEPYCALPSAGFTYKSHPAGSNKSPVTVTVTDTSTSAFLCPVTIWAWNWGDGVTTYGQDQSPHVYYNNGSTTVTHNVTLTVTNIIGSNTSGAVVITVAP